MGSYSTRVSVDIGELWQFGYFSQSDIFYRRPTAPFGELDSNILSSGTREIKAWKLAVESMGLNIFLNTIGSQNKTFHSMQF